MIVIAIPALVALAGLLIYALTAHKQTEWFTRDAAGEIVPLVSTDIVYSTDPDATMRRVLDPALVDLRESA